MVRVERFGFILKRVYRAKLSRFENGSIVLTIRTRSFLKPSSSVQAEKKLNLGKITRKYEKTR